ncbi:MAG: hypothetical protein JWM11_3902, partial [Planctomycetaceae bacterium]|nr:hypothetical protein [Planctomycetaceae bacterium]
MHGSSVISRLKGSEFRIDRICRRFEQSWQQDRSVSIEDCLSEVEPVEQPRLLEELIASDWELRIRHDEVPRAAEYLERFSEHYGLVEAVTSALSAEFAEPVTQAANSLPQEGDHLGDYRIIREIGRGGMGIVFEARQESLGRQVALKVLPARRFQNERELLRFRREAQSVARLHHSHIVEIYGVGEQEGVHYFAMRYIVGRSLDEVICELRHRLGVSDAQINISVLDEPATGRASPSAIHTGSSLFLSRILSAPQDSIDSQNPTARYRAVARIGHQVAEALQYAHERGILHRDVKPSNLLLDRQEVCWLSDFGLAKFELEAADITESDDLIGTMKYMSPEALSGAIDERSDLYSLGLTMYELATLRPVLDAVDRGQLLEQVKDPRHLPLRRFAPEIPRDLETVILKAMAVDPNHRYQSAAELADDLERFLNHEPIKARPQSTWTKLRRWIERKPLLAFLALGTISITMTSLFSFASLYFNARQTAFSARQERDRADQLRTEAEDAKSATEVSRKRAELLTIESQHRLIQVQRSKAATRLQNGDDFESLAWTAETLRLLEEVSPSQLDNDAASLSRPDGPGRQTESALDDMKLARSDRAHHLDLGPALRLRVGAIAEYAPRILRRVWLPKRFPTWSSSSTTSLDAARHSWEQDRILFDRSGQQVILADASQTRQICWDLQTGQFEASRLPDSKGTSVYTRSGEARITWEPNQTLTYQSTESSAPPRTLQSPPNSTVVRPLAAWQSPNRKYLLVSFQSAEKHKSNESAPVSWLWDVELGQLANSASLPVSSNFSQVEFSHDSRRLFVRSEQAVDVLDLPGWNPLLSNEPIDPLTTAWSHDGHWLATKSGSYTALYNLELVPPQAPQLIESPGLRGIRFEEGGGGMALLLQRGHIAFLSIGDGHEAQFRDFSHPHEIDIRSFNYSPDGQFYALAYNDENVRIWSVHYNQPLTGLLRHSSAVTSVAWSPRGDMLGTLTQDGLLTVWDVRSCTATGKITFHPESDRLNSVHFAADGAAKAYLQQKSTAGLELTQLSPNGHLLAASQSKGKISLTRVPDGRLVHTLMIPENQAVHALIFNNRGTQLAAVGQFGLQVWDAFTGEALKPSDDGPVSGLELASFSQDDHYLATVTENHVCQIYNTSTWERNATTFQLESRPVLAKFHPANQTYLTLTETGVFQLWDWPRGELLTPPLRNVQAILDADLSHDGAHLAVLSDHAIRVWKLPTIDRRPVTAIADWAKEVSLSVVDADEGTLLPLPPKQFPDHNDEVPREQQAGSPFTIAAKSEWHLNQANEAQLSHDAVAADFHIQRLRELAPKHPELDALQRR